MSSVTDTTRMSHRTDPHTSKEAAEKASAGTKKALLYGAILEALELGRGTPADVLARYHHAREGVGWLPADVDLQEIRRRMTELQHDQGLIEPIQVGTLASGKPQWQVFDGQRVMRLVTS